MLSREEIKKLSNDELKSQLRSAKISCGPITTTTRRIYEGRLNAHFEIQRKNEKATPVPTNEDTGNDTNKSKINPEIENKENQPKKENQSNNENQPNNEDHKINYQIKENNNKNIKSKNDIDTDKKDDLIITTASIDENHFAVGNQKVSGLKNDSSDTKNESENKQNVNSHNQTSTPATTEEEKEEIGDGFFYGVWVPLSPSRIKLKNKPKVFFSKKSALDAVKKYSGSRFKQFKTKEEAENFSLTPPNLVTVDKVIAMVAKNNKEPLIVPKIEAFKVPTVQEVQKFRKFIEDGDMYNFQKCINNPKYLINSKDFPVVVHEGMRSNALHAAIKSDRLSMCQFIMDRVTSIETYVDMYPETPVKDLEFRKEHIEKLFLNTPEKIVRFLFALS